ncbi:uncharacterized protein L3040_008514 [Drepanopeziza brunnea f. sp. 'multigermtubi']|uniref:uncharacterized protein n=1 Tax=Drepanopeziza brunnea f. sp. 'multigermtubi' TaxID=698441 RepID=UPI0023931AE8|nr:hypothetical protein L3040_008514 [Drepanopeziza brunnea f. sp. 'multigermtubi']
MDTRHKHTERSLSRTAAILDDILTDPGHQISTQDLQGTSSDLEHTLPDADRRLFPQEVILRFHAFSRLPTELRLIIWKMCMPVRGRKIRIGSPARAGAVEVASPVTLWVNRESRAETQRDYRLLWDGTLGAAYWNPGRDVVCFPRVSLSTSDRLFRAGYCCDKAMRATMQQIQMLELTYVPAAWALFWVTEKVASVSGLGPSALDGRRGGKFWDWLPISPHHFPSLRVLTLVPWVARRRGTDNDEKVIRTRFKALRAAMSEYWTAKDEDGKVRNFELRIVDKVKNCRPRIV